MSDKQNKLLIVSDTPMWGKREGEISVFEPTLREVEQLAEIFETIEWIGYCHGEVPKSFARSPIKTNIKIILLPYAVGGKSFIHKLRLLLFMPKVWCVIRKHIKGYTYVHTRGPSFPALLVLLFSFFDRTRIYWHKYAGNWRQQPAPFAYALQRFLLRKNPHPVTINGTWPGEASNIINLENPCLTKTELHDANEMVLTKQPASLVTMCFVGALVPGKGIHQFVDSLAILKYAKKLDCVYIVGDGSERDELERKTSSLSINVKFLGNIKRAQINTIYNCAHIIVLPSKSEGFPKVIAEAAAFGCVPIVSNVSAISQYVVHDKNGLLLDKITPESIGQAIDVLLADSSKLERMKSEIVGISHLFTFERYLERVEHEVLKMI